MLFIKSSTILSEVISTHHFLVPVINRFGIKLGLGQKTINQICSSYGLDEGFFLTIINTYLHEDYFPENQLKKFDIQLVAEYLTKVNRYFVNFSLSNLEKHLNAFIAMSDKGNTQLLLLNNLFSEFKTSFLGYVSDLQQYLNADDSYFYLLGDLKNILIEHISGSFNENLCYAVLFSVDSFLDDLSKHNRIRDKVFKPMAGELDETGLTDWESLVSADKTSVNEERQQISARELEVLKLIAQGCINKEIADKLNISLNTVLSHRKNITAKLKIKTVSGLAFYCLSHGYISPESVEL